MLLFVFVKLSVSGIVAALSGAPPDVTAKLKLTTCPGTAVCEPVGETSNVSC
jgi:hypothetical protein